MKLKNITYFLLLFFILFVSCVKDFEELNKSPNDMTSTEPEYLFLYALKQGVGNYNSDVTLEQWSIMNWMMYMAVRGGLEQGKDYQMPSGKDAFWEEQYTQGLANVHQLIETLKEDPLAGNKLAAARIWKVFLFHRLTDLWGDIPYSDALKGISELNYTPEYDNQKDIYYDMLKELKESAEQINSSLPFFDAGTDIIYNGNILNWEKFANSLRLRLAIRIKYIDNLKYQYELEDLKNKNFIGDNNASAIFPFGQQKKNHVYEAYYSGQATEQNNPSKFLVDLMKNTNDPRLMIYLEESPISQVLPWYEAYNGVPNLVHNTDPVWDNYDPDNDGSWGDISPIGSWYLRSTTPGVLFSYSEVCFLKAEATIDGSWPGIAQDLYEEGIRAHMDFLVYYGDTNTLIQSAAIDSYIASLPLVSLEQIITQKWILFAFENGYEAYSEYRRTGYPVLVNYDGTEIDQTNFPLRMSYPNTEYSYNAENVTKTVANQGSDNASTPVWWDVN